jgi:hypothetical protein
MQPDNFVVVRLLPLVDGEPRYRDISAIDQHQTTMLHSQINSMSAATTASARLLLSMHADNDAAVPA